MFIDKTKIYVKAGDGGNGSSSFRKEKYVPTGGPDGGDGGNGGDIILKTDTGMNNLIAYKHQKHFRAENGGKGLKKNCHGKSADDLIIKVPVGTVVKEAESGQVIIDMNKENQEFVLLKGGKGGLGNQHFATSRQQAPRYAENGKEGKELLVIFELKTIADVGLVGFPNAGKSTLLSAVTNANPKIGSYQFTTLSPNMGVVKIKSGKTFLMADIPGLIEDAHKGAGLGFEFLRHIERTKVLIHVVDAAGTEGRNPLVDIEKINNELHSYSEKLAKKPQVIAANKIDVLPEGDDIIEKIKSEFEPNVRVFPISGFAHKGLDELFNYVATMLDNNEFENVEFKQEYFISENTDEKYNEFTVTKYSDDYYVVEGRGVEKMIGYTNIETEKGLDFVQKFMKEHKIIDELKRKGLKEGDTVRIYDIEFEYME
ncbi:MAG TPA: GTPase CgtA [Clostridiales bacterium]|nr:MAG: GTPase CgtA [Clostridiales bacterium GWD2_32_59]HAN10008.1 GTPase CgtA [Clostridiales bacterium]